MRKAIYAMVILFIAGVAYAGEPDKQLHEKCLYPTVLIQSDPIGGFGTGSIFLSEKYDDEYYNFVLTCEHVVQSILDGPSKKNNSRISFVKHKINIVYLKYKDWSTLDKKEIYSCDILYKNKDLDLSILVFKTKYKMPTVDFGFDEKLYIGSKIFKIGGGLGDNPRLDRGEVTFLDIDGLSNKQNPLKHSHRISAITVQGDSGGPCFCEDNDGNYKQVMVTRAMAVTTSMSFIPSNIGNLNLPINQKVFAIGYGTPIKNLEDIIKETVEKFKKQK